MPEITSQINSDSFLEKEMLGSEIKVKSLSAKDKGQFFTPDSIADYMVSLVDLASLPSKVIIADPGAGKGILGISLAKHLKNKGIEVHLVAFENDDTIIQELTKNLDRASKNLDFSYDLQKRSFLSENQLKFDVVIQNPPYFKLKAKSCDAGFTRHLYKGAPNIYASFMAIAMSLLNDQGQLISITPRSFTNGIYFKGFRQYMQSKACLKRYHIFDSRKEAFGSQAVLQETVITHFSKGAETTYSRGVSSSIVDMYKVRGIKIPVNILLKNGVYRMPVSADELSVLRLVEDFDSSFKSLGLKVSTGPIVEHRNKEFIHAEKSESSTELFRMHNVRFPETVYTGNHRKDVYYDTSMGRWLVPNSAILLIKRFTSKEEKRRFVVSKLSFNHTKLKYLAIENHVNYLYGDVLEKGQFMTGLQILLSSSLMDSYYRIISGNTQVNASDLNSSPLPSSDIIEQLGAEVKGRKLTLELCSAIVNKVIVYG